MDAFDILAVAPSYSLDLSDLARRQRELSRALHPDKFVSAAQGERRQALGRAIEVNEAYRALKDPLSRAEILLKRLGLEVQEGGQPPASPDFLMTMMEEREELRSAGRREDLAVIESLRDKMAGEVARASKTIAQLFEEALRFGEQTLLPHQKFEGADLLHQKLGELRFQHRFITEADVLLDELL